MLDFDKEFESFIAGGQTSSAIKEIHQIIPCMTKEQMKLYSMLRYYAAKWQLDDLINYLDTYKEMMQTNKNLGMLSSFNMKNLLKAYTQDELIRGIKVQNTMNSGEVK